MKRTCHNTNGIMKQLSYANAGNIAMKEYCSYTIPQGLSFLLNRKRKTRRRLHASFPTAELSPGRYGNFSFLPRTLPVHWTWHSSHLFPSFFLVPSITLASPFILTYSESLFCRKVGNTFPLNFNEHGRLWYSFYSSVPHKTDSYSVLRF